MKIAAVRADLRVKAGAAGAFINMMRVLRERGHTVDVFTLSCSDELKPEMKELFNIRFAGFEHGPTSRYLPGLALLLERLRAIPYIIRMARMVREGDYDMVFVDHYNLSTMIFPLLGGLRKVYYCHEPPRRYYDSELIKGDLPSRFKYAVNLPFYLVDKIIDRRLAREADLILTNSDFTRECVWKAYGVFGEAIHQGVDSEEHRPVPGVEKDNFLLTIGVIQAHKGHDFVIRSLARVPEDIRPRLVVVYYKKDDRLFRRIVDEARSLEVEVEFKNFVDDDEFAYLHSAALFEVLGVIMEPSQQPVSFAYGLPIVAVREGGLREVIKHGETGLLTDRDEDEYAAAVEQLLRHPEQLKRMGENARRWVESEFTWDACGDKLERCLADLLGQS